MLAAVQGMSRWEEREVELQQSAGAGAGCILKWEQDSYFKCKAQSLDKTAQQQQQVCYEK